MGNQDHRALITTSYWPEILKISASSQLEIVTRAQSVLITHDSFRVWNGLLRNDFSEILNFQKTDDWMDFQEILKYGVLQGVLMILPICISCLLRSPNVAVY